MNTFLNNAARSVIFILFTAGLLCVLSFIISYGFELLLSEYLDVRPPGFLESAGIVAFVYVIFFGINFGNKKCTDKMAASGSKNKIVQRNTVESTGSSCAEELSSRQKRELCDILAKSCGFESPEK